MKNHNSRHPTGTKKELTPITYCIILDRPFFLSHHALAGKDMKIEITNHQQWTSGLPRFTDVMNFTFRVAVKKWDD